MKVKNKIWKQFIPRPLDEVWHFFSRPENLNDLTPEDMSFEILTPLENVEMYEGMIVEYKVSPIPGIKMYWVTEITHVRDRQYFIDEQRFGPYALWHHQHHFEATAAGVWMTDILHYKVPYGIIGNLADWIFVRHKVASIFEYRIKAVERIFGVKSEPFSNAPGETALYK